MTGDFQAALVDSNNRELEVETATSDEESQSYAKQQLGTRKDESKLLQVPWDKEKDDIRVSFSTSTAEPLNKRPLCYVEDDIQLPVPTPYSWLFLRSNQLPKLDPPHLREFHQRRRAKYLRRCKQALWTRWTTEYFKRIERTTPDETQGSNYWPKERWSSLIKERNRNEWKIRIVEDLISGRDGIVQAAKLRARKGTLGRAVQHLYPLELSYDRENVQAPPQLDPEAPTFRPSRDCSASRWLSHSRCEH